MKGVTHKKLSECCIINPPKSEARKILADADLVSFVPMNELGIDKKYFTSTGRRKLSEVISGYTYFSDNDVLLAKITPCFENGKMGIARELSNNTGFGSSEFIVFRAKNQLIPEYLYYFLVRPEFRETGKKIMTGAAGHKRLPKYYIENAKIPVPPIQEQTRIVEILDQAFENIEKIRVNTEKNLKNARELFESYLQQVFSQGGGDWETKKLGDVCEVIQRGISPKYIDNGGLCVVNQKCVRDHNINYYLARRHNIELKSVKEAHYIKIGDVLVNSTGTGTLGRVAQVRSEPDEPTTVDTHVTIVRPLPGKFYDDFFGYMLIKIEDEIASSGEGASGQTELSRSALKNKFNVSYPMDKKQQKAIVEELDMIKQYVSMLEKAYRKKISELNHLKKSLLHQAFTGQLTKQEVAV